MATHRKTKHTFLWKGVTEHGMVRTFITRNGKLLIHHHGNMRYFSFFNPRQWMKLVGSRENADTIFGRAAFVRGGDEALKNGGYLQKRLYLQGCFGRSWKYIALMSTFIPHIMDDAKNCPMVARQKIRLFDAFCGDLKAVSENIKQDLWLGGVKVPMLIVRRPDGLSFKPQHRNDVYYIRAMLHTEHYNLDCHEWLLSNQHRRREIKGINKDFPMLISDAFSLKQRVVEAGMQLPKLSVATAMQWAQQVHDLYNKHEADIMLARDARTNAMPLPGENFIPQLEEFRVKTKGDLRRAGIECHHCVGSYADHQDMVHYRKGQVVCQVMLRFDEPYYDHDLGRESLRSRAYINQCYDFANKTTAASRAFQWEVQKHLDEMEFSHLLKFQPETHQLDRLFARREVDAMPF